MSSLDLELDGGLNKLETQWHRADLACVYARADFERLEDCGKANGGLIDIARLRMQRAEALKLCLMVRMESAGDCLVSGAQS